MILHTFPPVVVERGLDVLSLELQGCAGLVWALARLFLRQEPASALTTYVVPFGSTAPPSRLICPTHGSAPRAAPPTTMARLSSAAFVRQRLLHGCSPSIPRRDSPRRSFRGRLLSTRGRPQIRRSGEGNADRPNGGHEPHRPHRDPQPIVVHPLAHQRSCATTGTHQEDCSAPEKL
jgi:hypothetical protein